MDEARQFSASRQDLLVLVRQRQIDLNPRLRRRPGYFDRQLHTPISSDALVRSLARTHRLPGSGKHLGSVRPDDGGDQQVNAHDQGHYKARAHVLGGLARFGADRKSTDRSPPHPTPNRPLVRSRRLFRDLVCDDRDLSRSIRFDFVTV